MQLKLCIVCSQTYLRKRKNLPYLEAKHCLTKLQYGKFYWQTRRNGFKPKVHGKSLKSFQVQISIIYLAVILT